MGGLGNQMFQIAKSKTEGYIHNAPVYFKPLSFLPMEGNQTITYVDNIFRNIDFKENINPQKLFNYILQNLETSTNIGILLKIHKILAGKHTKIVLYTYDSFLLDWDEDEEQELEAIKNIFKELKLSIKINGGKSYDF